MADIIQFKRGLSTAWTSINPVLAETEIGVETDTGKEKQGDAITPWNNLPYKNAGILISAKTYADDQDVINLQASKDYADGLNDPTVDHEYLTIPAMLSLQNEQLEDDLIKVEDAGADSRITGKAYYFYNGTIAGTIDDYHLLSNSEIATLTGQAVIDALGYTPEPLNVPPIADNKVTVRNADGSKRYEDLPIADKTLAAISNLKSETVNFEGKTVNVLGYYTKGDGGDGLFYWDAVSTEADNGGTIIQATSVTTGRWKRVFSGAVNVKWFGAKGDGVTNDYEFIQKAIAATPDSGEIIFPYKFVFNSSNLLVFPKEIKSIKMYGELVYTGSLNEPFVTIGSASNTFIGSEHILNIRRENISDWVNENSIGVKIINANTSDINIVQVNGFTIGAQFIGEDGGVSYNKIRLGLIYSNKIGIDLNNDSTSGVSWCNENTFYNGRFGTLSIANVGKSRYGIRVASKNGDYYNNSNLFFKPSFELSDTTSSPGESIPILIEYGNRNNFLYCRNEGNSNTTLRILNDSSENEITASYGEAIVDDAGNYPYTKSVNSREALTYQPKNLVVSSGKIRDKSAFYNGSTNINVAGFHIASSASAAAFPSLSSLIIQTDYLEVTPQRGVGFFVDTDKNKRFTLVKDAEEGFGGRISIRCYDENGAILDNLGANAPYVKSKITTGFNYKSSFGKVYQTGIDNDNAIYFKVSEDVKKIVVILHGGTNNLKIKSFSLYTYDLNLESIYYSGLNNPINNKYNIATTPPTVGNWEEGRIIYNANISKDTPTGWIYSGSGIWEEFPIQRKNPPIQNTDTPYLTEAAMHADQSNQLQGYGYLVDGVGAFTYLGTVAGTAADYKGFGANLRLSNLAGDLSTAEQDGIKTKLSITARTIKSIGITTTYPVVLDDKIKHLHVGAEFITIPTGVFSEGDLLVITCSRSGGSTLSGLNFLSDALLAVSIIKLRLSGTVFLNFISDSMAIAWGDIPKAPLRIYSPNGSVWQIEVDDTGNLTTTAL